ncbi:ABC-type nitrate/sulfonate/bicarbonate transport system permease component [Actinocorallia herbida]|uniref:ABC-type nitrate/sulfonate/bicarbonate transport system permease component n=1 Tax=Actinocorallia herbida TaxID=58109 RepID=A0A3N1D859_9ACTN|nr:ABC transporter permease subunit [Actinocorallia herbida]ROO89681.1 ABC-type nitrate/sulfonate/bicarbonate transport system permease component [Actinocorallia herbida]
MILKRTAGTLLSITVSLVLVVVAWLVFIRQFDMNPMVVRGPGDVWAYLFTAETAEANRALVWDDLTITLVDAGLGLVVGLIGASVIAVAFVLSTAAEQAFMPIAMIMRSVPLVAMTPVLTLVFGRELTATTVIVGIVVFFPALVNLVLGLRSASPQAVDLVRAYGGGTWTAMRKVLIPSALPAFFTSARISAPGAIIGAMLAEWLATGKGIGYRMLQDVSTFESDNLWTSVVVITLVSLAVYSVISVVENIVLARFGRNA